MGNGETESIHLEVTRKFIRERDSWLLAPFGADKEYWGEWEKEEFNQLILIFPAKDGEIGRRLAPALHQLIAEICDNPDVQCPRGFSLQLRLDRNERSLPILNEHLGNIGLGTSLSLFSLNLPAPTLIGRPVDDAGYQALYSGYAGWVAAAIASGFGVSEISGTREGQTEFLAKWDLRLPPEPPMPLPRPYIDITPEIHYHLLRKISCFYVLMPAGRDYCDIIHLKGLGLTNYKELLHRHLLKSNCLFPKRILSPLPDHSATLIRVSQMTKDGAQSRIYLWQDGKETLLVDSDMAYSFLPTQLENYAGLNCSKCFSIRDRRC